MPCKTSMSGPSWNRMILNIFNSSKFLVPNINVFSCIRHLVPEYMDLFSVRNHLCLLGSLKQIPHFHSISPISTLLGSGPSNPHWFQYELVLFMFYSEGSAWE